MFLYTLLVDILYFFKPAFKQFLWYQIDVNFTPVTSLWSSHENILNYMANEIKREKKDIVRLFLSQSQNF